MKLDALETIDEFMAKMGDHKMCGPFWYLVIFS
jgi:hypothetical protein